jgi:hypothetical protein
MMMNLSPAFSLATMLVYPEERGLSAGNLITALNVPFQDSESHRRRKVREQVARCWDLLQMEEERNRTDCRN